DVARELGQLVVRDEQPVLTLELEVDVVAGDAADRLRVEAEETPHAVLDVHDVVVGAQVCRARERTAEAPGDRGPGGAAAEQPTRPAPAAPAPRRRNSCSAETTAGRAVGHTPPRGSGETAKTTPASSGSGC